VQTSLENTDAEYSNFFYLFFPRIAFYVFHVIRTINFHYL